MYRRINKLLSLCIMLVIAGGCGTSSKNKKGSTGSSNILDGMRGPYHMRTHFGLEGGDRHIGWEGRWILRTKEESGNRRNAELIVNRGLGLPGLSCDTRLRIVSMDSSASGMVSRAACLTREGISASELESWLVGWQASNPALSMVLRPYQTQHGIYLTNQQQVTGTLFIEGCQKEQIREFAQVQIPRESLRLQEGEKTDSPTWIPSGQLQLIKIRRQAWKDLQGCTDGKQIGPYPGNDALLSDLEVRPTRKTGASAVAELAYITEELGREDRLTNTKVVDILYDIRSAEGEPGPGREAHSVRQLEEARAGFAEALNGALDEEVERIFDQAITDVFGSRPIITGPLPEICVEPPETCDSPPLHVDASAEYGPDGAPDGSIERPYPTITSVLEVIREGDFDCAPIVMVTPGLYRENLIDPPSARIRAKPGGTPVILGRVRIEGSVSFEMNGLWISGSRGGPALSLGQCTSVDVLNSRILGSSRYGIHQSGGRLLLAETDITGVSREGDGRTEGTGLYQQSGSAVLQGVRFRFNEGPAILAQGSGSQVKGKNVEIYGNSIDWPGETPESTAGLGAVEAGDGARIILRNSSLTDNDFIGLLARGGGSIEFTGGYVQGTKMKGHSEGSGFGGFGAFALGGIVSLKDFTLSENELCGMAVANDGNLDAQFGLVEHHPIGASIHIPDYPISRISFEVEYRDNDINLESRTTTLPGPVDFSF